MTPYGIGGSVMATVSLSRRQEECLRLSSTMTDKEIARELGLSPHTVSLHIREAMRKMRAPSRKIALRSLAENPLYPPPGIPFPSDPPPPPHVSSQSDCDPQLREGGTVRSFSAMALAPAYLPAPPRLWGSRIWPILLAGLLVLIAGAALLGLLGFVIEVVNRWAVDPNQH